LCYRIRHLELGCLLQSPAVRSNARMASDRGT